MRGGPASLAAPAANFGGRQRRYGPRAPPGNRGQAALAASHTVTTWSNSPLLLVLTRDLKVRQKRSRELLC